MKKITVRDAYLALSNASGIKVGDTVKVLRKAKTNELGWNNSWNSNMNGYVGRTFQVQRLDDGRGFRLSDGSTGTDCYSFPFFVLEKMPKPKPVVPTEKTISISGATVRLTYSTLSDRVLSHVTDDRLSVTDLKDIIKEANKFLKQHRDASKA